jgi:hypothetical protein
MMGLERGKLMKKKQKRESVAKGGLPPAQLFLRVRGLKEAARKIAKQEQLWLNFEVDASKTKIN